jgi:hypothetical protein
MRILPSLLHCFTIALFCDGAVAVFTVMSQRGRQQIKIALAKLKYCTFTMTLRNDMHGRSSLIGHVSTAPACIQIGFSPPTHTYVWRHANKKAKG